MPINVEMVKWFEHFLGHCSEPGQGLSFDERKMSAQVWSTLLALQLLLALQPVWSTLSGDSLTSFTADCVAAGDRRRDK
jgi:hypothetical protein